MAKRTILVLTDDLDGGEAAETLSFSVDGVAYEIDLSAKNAQRFRETLMPWMGASRRIGRTGAAPAPARGRGQATAANSIVAARERNDLDNKVIREWATRAGKRVNERGRLPEALVAQYREAQAREAIGPIERPEPQFPPIHVPEPVTVEVEQPDFSGTQTAGTDNGTETAEEPTNGHQAAFASPFSGG